jgi:hypothetical protein
MAIAPQASGAFQPHAFQHGPQRRGVERRPHDKALPGGQPIRPCDRVPHGTPSGGQDPRPIDHRGGIR